MTTNKMLLDIRHPIFSTSFLGFDRLFDDLFNAYEKTGAISKDRRTSYPPYNVLKDGDIYTIEMALAGLTDKDIEVVLEDRTLNISYDKIQEEETDAVHRGIAYRSFKRSFNLAEDIEVKEAKLINGLLSVVLERVIPEKKKPKRLKLST